MIVASSLSKRYGRQEALRDVSCRIEGGEMLFITGHSGAGKTTLFKMLGALERPTSGALVVNGQNVASLRSSAFPWLRRNYGLVFQDHKLLFDRNAFENVLLPLQISGYAYAESCRRARAALDKVGLLSREKNNPVALSGGEQQRLAIARAIVNRPVILLADEPTGNLDRESANSVLDLFYSFHQVGVTVVIATHETNWAQVYGKRRLHLEHGALRHLGSADTSALTNPSHITSPGMDGESLDIPELTDALHTYPGGHQRNRRAS